MALAWGRRRSPGLGRRRGPDLKKEARLWSEGTGRKSENPVVALASEVKVQLWLPPSVLTPPHHPPPRQFLSPCVRPNLPTALLHHQGHHQPLDRRRLAGLLL